MNLNYAIFRSEPIYTLKDLAQIGSHNKREKKAYNSNPDIVLEKTKDNIELKPLADKYVKGFYNITEEYKKEHDERMKTERTDRKKTFNQMLNKSKNVVADELLFTATNEFFKDMNKDDIKKWADTCMEFVYNDLGYTKEQVLHATVHMDEKTPHIHCVVIPLVKKLDNRTNTERYTISKKQYIKDKMHLSELQDKYHARLVSKGFDLERGIKNSDNQNIKIKEYKKITRKLEREMNIKHDKLDNAISEFNSNMKDSKNVLFDKDYVKVKKETFDSMNNVIKETSNLMKVQEKVEHIFKEVDSHVKSYNSIQKENTGLKKEVENLKNKNEELKKENNLLMQFINNLIDNLKKIFRKILLIGDYESQDMVCEQVKDIYNEKYYESKDVYHISRGTERQDELYEYADIPDYWKEEVRYYDEEKDKIVKDFEIGM